MKKNVLVVHENLGFFGGAEQNIYDTCSRLRKQFTFSLLYKNRTGREEKKFEEQFHKTYHDEKEAFQNGKPDLIYLHKCQSIPLLEKIVESGLPAIRMMHDHELYCLTGSKYFPLSRTPCQCKAPFCCLFPGMALFRGKGGGIFTQKKLLSLDQKLSCHFVASSYMKQELERQGYDPNCISLLPPVPSPVQEEGKQISSFSEKNRILYVGQVIRGKGLDLLLRAVSLMTIPFELVVIGEGSYLESCQNLAKRLGIEKNVQFTGFLTHEKIKEYYREASVVVVPSLWPEPFGLVGLEAMRFGLPVVGFATGGISDWLKDGENGFLLPPKDVSLLREKIAFLLQNKEEAKRLGQNGISFYQRDYDFFRYINDIRNKFNEIIDNKM